ncbi:MAG: putative lipid II flippase FtsW [Actinobacteria bacterium]|nr:putative lipid II flippase FtsW [Actinomycetota bacterium]
MAARSAAVLPAARAEVRLTEARSRRSSRTIAFVLIPVGLLLVIGLGAVLSASSVLAIREGVDNLYYFKRQIMWMGAGMVALIVAALTSLRVLRKLAFPAFVVSVALLVATLVVGTRAYGSTRWLIAGPISIQASELAKLTTILFLATLVSRKETSMHRIRDFMWPVAISVGVVGVLVILQPDLGTALMISFGSFAVLVASAAPFGYVMAGALFGTGAAVIAAASSPYRWARITSFLDLGGDPLGAGYQVVQSLVALGTGGMWGVGLGASRARWSFLPNAHTDFIFSIIGEETGLAGSLIVVGLFVAFTVAGTMVALRASDRFGRLVAIGITTWLVVQALVNIGGVTGVLPITGVPLPFVSIGGSALLTEMAAVGILVSVARTKPESRTA